VSTYAYILLSLKNGKYYYGSTQDLEERIKKHNGGKVKSTKPFRPWKIHYFEKFGTSSEAFKREMFFKSVEGYIWLKENNIK